MITSGYERIKQTALNYVAAMKVGAVPGRYKKERAETEPGLYGSYHAAQILDLFDALGRFSEADIDTWAQFFQEKQCDQGYFTNRPEEVTANEPRVLRQMDPVWHNTRGMIWALRVLNRRPLKPLAFMEPFMDPKVMYDYVKSYDWSNSWAAGNQICALGTAMLAVRDWFGESDVDRVMEQGMYPALEELLDESTGYWGTQFGADLYNGQFGTIHITPIYFAMGWPLRAIERNVDSTLACQLADGSFWPGGSDCPDFDGAYMMMNGAALTDYRREDLNAAARRYLAHALMHEDPAGCGFLLHRRDSQPQDWKPRPHFVWLDGEDHAREELRDDDPARTHIMLGSWFYPLSIALVAHMLGDTGYEGPYKLNPMSLHECNVGCPTTIGSEDA